MVLNGNRNLSMLWIGDQTVGHQFWTIVTLLESPGGLIYAHTYCSIRSVAEPGPKIRGSNLRGEVLVDTGATNTCVASSVGAILRLTIDAYDNVVTSLNAIDH